MSPLRPSRGFQSCSRRTCATSIPPSCRHLPYANGPSSAAAADSAGTEAESAPMAERLEHTVPGVRAPLSRIRDRVLIWYDYASMFQTPRTPAEQQAFRHEIVQLNRIQARAATVVIAGDHQYTSRAWCFLEMCAGMRHHIVELVPSWGTRVSACPRPRRPGGLPAPTS